MIGAVLLLMVVAVRAEEPAAGAAPELVLASYLGGSSNDRVLAVAAAPDGSFVVTGATLSADFPGTGRIALPPDPERGNVFATVLEPDGTTIRFTTFIEAFEPSAVAVAPDGSFAIGGAIGEGKGNDAFVAWLDAGGTSLRRSERFDVAGSDRVDDLAFLADGTLAVAVTSFEDDVGRGEVRLYAPAGELRATYAICEESGTTSGLCLAADPDGTLLVAGATTSKALPVTPGACQERRAGDHDLFVLRLDRSGGLLAATYCGGAGFEYLGPTPRELESSARPRRSLAIAPDRSIVLVAVSASARFAERAPVAAEPPRPEGNDALHSFLGAPVVIRLRNDLGAIAASARLPRSLATYSAIAIEPSGRVLLAGVVEQDDYPTTANAYRAAPFNTAEGGGWDDALLVALDPELRTLEYATRLGGSQFYCCDAAAGVAVNAEGVALCAGTTRAPDLATTPNAFPRGDADGERGTDGFLYAFCFPQP